jgi:phosphohistidine phosphatase SixA
MSRSLYNPCCCPFAGTPDHRVQLTAKGHTQALKAGQALKELMGPDGRAYFYVSPYVRTLQTAQDIGSCLDRDQVGARAWLTLPCESGRWRDTRLPCV